MDIPNGRKGAHSRDPERARLLRENSYLSSSEVNYYGSTPTSLKIPNVNSISDLNEVERAFNNYSSNFDEIAEMPGASGRKLSQQLSQSLSTKRLAKRDQSEGTSAPVMFRMDSEAFDGSASLDAGQLSNSIKTTTTTRQMNNFVSSGSMRLNSYNAGDTNSLYQCMRGQRRSQKAQIYESLDYEVNENVLYLMEKKRSLRAKQNSNRFCKYIRSYFPSQKEASRWFTIFLIGTFTALTACFIAVVIDAFSEMKYRQLHDLFEHYLDKNKVMTKRNTTDALHPLNSTDSLNSTSLFLNIDADSFKTLSFDKSVIGSRLIKLQIPMLFWFLTNAVPTLLGALLVTYLGESRGDFRKMIVVHTIVNFVRKSIWKILLLVT